MRLYYIGESEGTRHYAQSALGVYAERWYELFRDLHEWRLDLRDRYGIPLCWELHAADVMAGWSALPPNVHCSRGRRQRDGLLRSGPGAGGRPRLHAAVLGDRHSHGSTMLLYSDQYRIFPRLPQALGSLEEKRCSRPDTS